MCRIENPSPLISVEIPSVPFFKFVAPSFAIAGPYFEQLSELPPSFMVSLSCGVLVSILTKDKTIVVIGCVRKRKTIDSVDKVPFFGDLPLVGGMFRHKKDQDKREELLVFLAPRII